MSRVTRTYFMLNVVDMDRALAFYRSVLGPIIRQEGDEWSELMLGDSTVALHRGGAEPRETSIVVEVEDLAVTCEAVSQQGGEVVAGSELLLPDGTRMIDVRDPEGNGFSLASAPGTPMESF